MVRFTKVGRDFRRGRSPAVNKVAIAGTPLLAAGFIPKASRWHIANFRCAAELRSRAGNADMDEPLFTNLIDEYSA
jgi:hypothetical protein